MGFFEARRVQAWVYQQAEVLIVVQIDLRKLQVEVAIEVVQKLVQAGLEFEKLQAGVAIGVQKLVLAGVSIGVQMRIEVGKQ